MTKDDPAAGVRSCEDGRDQMTTPSPIDDQDGAAETARPPSPDPLGALRRVARLALGLAEAAGGAVTGAADRRSATVGAGWDAAVGAGVVASNGVSAAGRLAARVMRPAAVVVLHPPLVPKAWHPARGLDALVRLGEQERTAARKDVDRAMTALLPTIVERVLERVSLTDLVRQHVDLDAIVAGVDLDAVAARLDVDAIAQRLDMDAVIARIDLVGLADEVIDGIDLPEIIRASTGTVASEVVRGVRMQSIDADQAVARVVDRLFLRRRRRATDAPGEPGSFDELDGVEASVIDASDGTRPQAPT